MKGPGISELSRELETSVGAQLSRTKTRVKLKPHFVSGNFYRTPGKKIVKVLPSQELRGRC